MGQTPPPWHGQAVATQILFDEEWVDFEVHRLRMNFSEDMDEVGRFQLRKLGHLWSLVREARRTLKEHPGAVLFYPPASARWVPFLRDIVFLGCVRYLAGSTVFIFHASGLPVFSNAGALRRLLSRRAYRGPEVTLEVAKEDVPAHQVFEAKAWKWCPCAIEVPEFRQRRRRPDEPLRVLFVGSLQEGKGVLEIVKTADILRDQGWEQKIVFSIVGKWFSAEFEREVRNFIETKGLGEMVLLPGQVTGDAKWSAYQDADVFFFPTHYASEATPIVLMEALGMGLPVISTQWAGIPAMLEGCQTSQLLPVRSPGDYASAIEAYWNKRGEMDEIARSSCEFYQKRYLPQRFVDRVGSAFLEAYRGGGVDETFESAPLRVCAYLADQNPKLGRSLGISRMSEVVLDAIGKRADVSLGAVVSKSSVAAPQSSSMRTVLPWSTRNRASRLLTDNLHPLLSRPVQRPDIWYFPKGYMPRIPVKGVSVATIHDTIIQYYQDHYPHWRMEAEYSYWAGMLRNTLTRADALLTVSENAKRQIEDFIDRHRLPKRKIFVTYEPCLYESIPQPNDPAKADYVLHLGSLEPHKRTAWLIRAWLEGVSEGRELPKLHVVGKIPDEVKGLVEGSRSIVYLPFLEDRALISQFSAARALILPSEVEGFGLPAVEAYYLGTPVCFSQRTSVEEVLAPAIAKGGFDLQNSDSLWDALNTVLALSSDEVRECGLTLRESYHSDKVVKRMIKVFREVGRGREA